VIKPATNSFVSNPLNLQIQWYAWYIHVSRERPGADKEDYTLGTRHTCEARIIIPAELQCSVKMIKQRRLERKCLDAAAGEAILPPV